MRPINLIPVEQRRGISRGSSHGGGASTGIGVYALLGGLGAAVLCVLAFVLTSNSINSKTEELAKVQAESQGDKQVADALRPYGQFASLQQAREQQITALAAGRFDWERSLKQLSQALPQNVYLLTVAATLSPDVEVSDGGAGGDVSNLRAKTPAPAFALSGCTYSQHAVARMMTRMHNLDDVTAVRLSKSVRKEDTNGVVGTAVTQGSGGEQADIQDCVGSSRVTKFDMLIEFGGATTAQAGAAAGVPSGAAQPIAAAQGAVAQSNAASAGATGASGATGATGTTPGGSAP